MCAHRKNRPIVIQQRWVFYALVIWGTLYLLADCADKAAASPVKRAAWPVWDGESKLDLGICLRAESDLFKRDWPLLSWCLVKQWRAQSYGRTISGQIRAHCAVFDPGGRRYYGKRPRDIRGSTWEKPLHGKREEWAQLRQFVEKFQARDISDPCPRCRWWAGDTDITKPHWTCPVKPVMIAGEPFGNSFCYVQK